MGVDKFGEGIEWVIAFWVWVWVSAVFPIPSPTATNGGHWQHADAAPAQARSCSNRRRPPAALHELTVKQPDI